MQPDDQNDQDDTQDQFDVLFEPFELDETPPPDESLPPRPATPPPNESAADTGPIPRAVHTVGCPSCGAQNPEANRHCEQCGARLSQEPLPVAPPPMVRATAGGRALGVLAAVVLVVGLGAIMFNIFRGGGDTAAEDASTTTSSTAPPIIEELSPSSVEASSELAGFEGENLLDGNPETYWNDESARGKDAWLRLRFSRPVQITEIELQNLQDETKFLQNYRIQGVQIGVDDIDVDLSHRLEDTQEAQRVPIASLDTTVLTISVTSTYPAQAVGDAPPFDELALQSVRFFGTER